MFFTPMKTHFTLTARFIISYAWCLSAFIASSTISDAELLDVEGSPVRGHTVLYILERRPTRLGSFGGSQGCMPSCSGRLLSELFELVISMSTQWPATRVMALFGPIN